MINIPTTRAMEATTTMIAPPTTTMTLLHRRNKNSIHRFPRITAKPLLANKTDRRSMFLLLLPTNCHQAIGSILCQRWRWRKMGIMMARKMEPAPAHRLKSRRTTMALWCCLSSAMCIIRMLMPKKPLSSHITAILLLLLHPPSIRQDQSG